MKRAIVVAAVLIANGCGKDGEQAARIDKLESIVATLQGEIHELHGRTEQLLKDETDILASITTALKDIERRLLKSGITDSDGKAAAHWWCTVAGCRRTPSECETASGEYTHGIRPPKCETARIAYCNPTLTKCYADYGECVVMGTSGTCFGVE